MNKAQTRLIGLRVAIPLTETKELQFINDCIRAWEGYSEQEISYPAWQLRGLEKHYNLTVNELHKKYI